MNESINPADVHPGLSVVTEPLRMVRIAQFLPAHERDALYQSVCANQAAFQPPGTTSAGALYLSMESAEINETQAGRLRYTSELLSKRILDLLPTLFTSLAVEPFAVSIIPLTFINGLAGHGGTPHVDSIDDRFKISLLYYFHRTPRIFCGGDLEFYRTDNKSPLGHSDRAFSRIENEDNLLIAFRSQTFHGITDVTCDSDDFADGRFVAVGFLG